jgi:hypothetical protein
VQVALLTATELSFVLAWGYRTARTASSHDAVATGALLALLVLTDPILGLAAAGVALAVCARQGARRAARPLAVAAAVALAGLVPWTVRNARVHGEFVFVKSTFGYAFWQGNCAASEGTDKVVRASVEKALGRARERPGLRGLNASLWEARHEAGYLDDVVLTADDYRALAAVSEPERSRRLFRRAVADLRDEPGRYARLCLRRLRYFMFFDETNPKTRNVVYRASHLGLSALAVLGLVFARPETRRRLAPTLVTAALVTAFHALTIVSARFHIPLEPLMAVWAACGLTRLGLRGSAASADDVVSVGVGLGLHLRADAAGRPALVLGQGR